MIRLPLTRVLAVACLLAGCAGPRQPARLEPPAGYADRPWADAAHARAAAVASRRRAAIDGVELRVRDLTVDNVSNADGVDFAVRVPLADNPWLVEATDEAWRVEADLELLELADVALAEDARLCLVSAEAQVFDQRRALHASTTGQLDEVLRWNREWAEAGTLDELTAAELELELGLWLVAETPAAQGAPRDDTAELAARFPLPDASAGSGLPDDPNELAARIRARHPTAREHAARAELHRLEAERESAAALPWLDFFEVSYRIGPDAGPGDIAAQIAVAFPFGIEASGESARHEQLAVSETYLTDAVVERLTEAALDARATLEQIAEQRDALESLLEAAERAEALALRWREERLGSPRQVSRVLRDVHAVRELDLRARLQAAEARCRLLATGAVGTAAE